MHGHIKANLNKVERMGEGNLRRLEKFLDASCPQLSTMEKGGDEERMRENEGEEHNKRMRGTQALSTMEK